VSVGRRLGRKLVERCAEEAVRILVATLTAADEGQVRDHLPLSLLVAQLR
jgi:hypothetical protein